MDPSEKTYNGDYSYISEDTVKVSKGVALDSLNLDRLPMYAATMINISNKTFKLKSISINGVEVARPDVSIIDSDHYDLNIAMYVNDYMSYITAKTLKYSVVVETSNGDTKTLTASVNLSANNRLMLNGSVI